MRPALFLPPSLPPSRPVRVRPSDHRLVGYHLFVVGHATLQAKITQRGKGDSENEERFEWRLGMWQRKGFMSLELSCSARTYVTRSWMEWRSPISVARGEDIKIRVIKWLEVTPWPGPLCGVIQSQM